MARERDDEELQATGNTDRPDSLVRESVLSRRSYVKSGAAIATGLAATAGAGSAAGNVQFRGFTFDRIVHAVDDLGLDPTGQTQINATIYGQTGGGDLVIFPDGEYLCGDAGMYGSTGGKPIGWVAEAAYESGDPNYDYDANVTFIADHGTNGYCPDTGNGATLDFLIEGIDYDFSLNDASQSGQCILGIRLHLDGRWEIRNVDTHGRAINYDNPGREEQMVGCSVRDPTAVGLIEHCDWREQHDWALYTTLDGSGAGGRMGVWTGAPHVGHIIIDDVKISEIGNNAFYMSTTDLDAEGSVELRNSYVSNCGAGGARLPMSPNSKIVNTTFEYDASLYTGPDYTDQQANSVSNRPVVVETTGQNGYHADGPFVIRDCHFRIRDTPRPSPVIHAYPGGRWVIVENCTFDLKDYDQTTSSPHHATNACLVQMSEARPHWGGQPKRTDPAQLEMRDCTGVIENVGGIGESLITIADRDGSAIENCCIQAIDSPHDGVTVERHDDAYDPFEVTISDSRIAVEGETIVNKGGNTIVTSNLEESGGCTLEEEPEPATTEWTDFSDDNDGAVPTGWTPRWHSTNDEWSVDTDAAVLRFEADANARRALSWDAISMTAGDVDLLAQVRVPSIASGGNHGRLHLRSGGSAGNEQGYYFDLREQGFALYSYPSGQLLEQVGTTASDTWYWIRFRAHGSDLKLRYWLVGTDEPDVWQIEVTDTEHTSGWVGVGSWDATPSEWGYVAVGTGGEAAPMPPSEVENPPMEDDEDPADDEETANELAPYADEDGIIRTDGVQSAVADWRANAIATSLLLEVIDAWRTGEAVV